VAPHVQNFSDLVQGKHFQIWGSMEESGEMCFFQPKTGRISKAVKDRAKVAING